ncbi:MAG TPA: TetR/AcrR family transcriptional regulator [Thermomicrobiales bacterium]|nr:TetR/AcrR family transcriptional regulator [Thermomicrobiales bacterium]
MPRISREEKERNHQKILEAASRRFRSEGLDAVGIDELMKTAGMTHGGFYNHFPSKDALAAAVCQQAFAASHVAIADEVATGAPLCEILRLYLSPEHRDDPDGGCPSAALVIDAGRHVGAIQDAYRDGVLGYLTDFTDAIVQDAANRGETLDVATARQRAMLLLSQVVGAMAISRAIVSSDRPLSDEILATVRDNLQPDSNP